MSDIPTRGEIDVPGATIYPNVRSYRTSDLPRGKTDTFPGSADWLPETFSGLKKARLYSVEPFDYETAGPIFQQTPGSPDRLTPTPRIDTTLVKEFQFNPPELDMSLQFEPIQPGEADQEGGNDARARLGLATSDVELTFHREQEVMGALSGKQRYSSYVKLGVAKDIMDVYAIIKRDREMLEASANGSLSDITAEMLDIVSASSEILFGQRVALSYSEDFTIFARVQGMQFRFTKWNHMLIPTAGVIQLNLEIHNTGNSSVISSQLAGIDPNTGLASSGALRDAWQATGGGFGGGGGAPRIGSPRQRRLGEQLIAALRTYASPLGSAHLEGLGAGHLPLTSPLAEHPLHRAAGDGLRLFPAARHHAVRGPRPVLGHR